MNASPAMRYPTAASLGLGGCSVCGQLNRVADRECLCRHCGMPVRTRKPNSLSRTWAFLLAAVFLYVPANLCPILESRTVAGEEGHRAVAPAGTATPFFRAWCSCGAVGHGRWPCWSFLQASLFRSLKCWR